MPIHCEQCILWERRDAKMGQCHAPKVENPPIVVTGDLVTFQKFSCMMATTVGGEWLNRMGPDA